MCCNSDIEIIRIATLLHNTVQLRVCVCLGGGGGGGGGGGRSSSVLSSWGDKGSR